MTTRKGLPFNELSPYDQRVILTKYLQEYGTWSFEKREEMMYRVTHKHYEYVLTHEFVCAQAATALHYEGRFADKFRTLVEWIKSRCLGNMYQTALYEPIEDALK